MANTFKNQGAALTTSGAAVYTAPAATTSILHSVYISNIDGTNDATINLSISGSTYFDTRRYILKTVDVPADSTVIIEKPINLGAGDKLETQASADGDIEAFASILEIT